MSKLVKKESEEEVSLRASKRTGIVIIVSVIALLAVAVVSMGIFRDFDAQKYVRGTLDQTFKGEVTEAMEMLGEVEEADLLSRYEESIQSFVENNVTSGIEVEEELKAKYILLCKEIFASMKYEVKEAEKVSSKEYKVPVEYQSTDIFSRFIAALADEPARLRDKAYNGDEYTGTEEEINQQMEAEFLQNAYELLKTAHQEMQYAETETIVFIVKKGENDLFAIKDGQIDELVVKIMELDEIQD